MAEADVQFGKADLTTCDREQIHVPGSVQSYGALIVLDPESLVIRQAAGATSGLLGRTPSDLVGALLSVVIPAEKVRRLEALLFESDVRRPMHLFDFVRGPQQQSLDMSVHRNDGGLILEFEEADATEPGHHNPLSQVQTMIAAVSEAASVDEFCQSATEHLHRATGYDRVMIYRFLPDDSGSVVAETVAKGHARFLGLRYPASDIPKQARALYLTNWLRIVVDVDDVAAPLEPQINPATGAALDMSLATLRSVSPIHLEYLRNMGVRATMTISLIKSGKLWGLIACHHHTVKQLPRHLRAVCELFGNMFALQLDARERSDALEYRHRSNLTHSAIVSRMSAHDSLAAGLIDERPTLLDYLDADGVAVLIEDNYEASGRTPRESQVRALVQWLDKHASDGTFVSDNLAGVYDLAKDFAIEASGILAISASRSPSDYIIWFRTEEIEAVRWAGDPSKPVEVGPHGDRLTPRKSFEEWVQSVRYQSRPWTENEIDAARHMRTSLLEVILRRIDELARERAAAQNRHELMVAELNHRVKNTLATIQALARYTHKSSDSLTAYVHDFDKRIQAMATSHNLLSEASWEQTDLRTLIAAQLSPYGQDANIVLDGSNVAILVRAAAPLGMVLHELATNAAKYGALRGGGQVRVTWAISGNHGERSLKIGWIESGGPTVTKPTREGFGTFTLNRIIPFQCGGQSALRYLPHGVECDIELGADCFVDDSQRVILPDARTDPEQAKRSEGLPRILVVEDETMIAFLIEQIVTDAGFEVVGPVSRLAKALEVAVSQPLSGALLDVNLAGDLTWPLAHALQDRGIPFVFMTGYAQRGFVPAEFENVPIIGKPFHAEQVLAAIAEMVGEIVVS